MTSPSFPSHMYPLCRVASIALVCLTSALSVSAQTSPVRTAFAGPSSPVVFDVRAYGAKGDSASLDTDAINRAIDAAAAAHGGTVYFGPGTYSTFSVHLKSNVALYLDRGATLLGASPEERPDAPGYDAAEPALEKTYQDYGHSHWHNSLIWGDHVENVAILGSGRIDGGALNRSVGRDMPRVGNKAIALVNARNVLLRDFTILKGGHFGVLATGVDNLTIDNLLIDTNRDGIDVDDCRWVRISNTVVNSPRDDAIVLKTSLALGELRGTENVTLANSIVSGYEVGSVLDGTYRPFVEGGSNRDGPTGRVKLGTESDGPFRNITITNVVFDNSRGLALETVDGAIIEDVTISNLTMRHVWTAPLFLRLGSRKRGPKGTDIGALRRVNISNVVASDVDPRYASSIVGVPGHNIEDVRLSNIRIQYRGGLTMAQVAAQPADMVRQPSGGAVVAHEPYAVPEQGKVYPEPSMFGLLPAYGFYVRHVQGLRMDGVDVSFQGAETRPAFVLDDVKDAEFRGVHSQKSADVPTFVLRDVEDVRVLQSSPVEDTHITKVDRKSF
ncbi:MAG: glycosyl hydrolase family 28 protein [Gemmatimonadota bacterium]|nr:glycosyl hydrolase family 28 protein [Gemmatimonadota bacterium]